MTRRQEPPSSIVLSAAQMEAAIPKIERRLRDLESFDSESIDERSDPRISALEASLEKLLDDIFGAGSRQYALHSSIRNLDRASIFIGRPTSIRDVREGLKKGISEAISILHTIKKGFEEDLADAGRGVLARPLRAYEGLDLHPTLESGVSTLYRSGHFSEAIEKAVKILNNAVRTKTGLECDGTALMQKAFSPKEPKLRFNKLHDQSDKDEQIGFMNLFCGAVSGLRNPRAHKVVKDDPERALEFIAFISLLMKLLDECEC